MISHSKEPQTQPSPQRLPQSIQSTNQTNRYKHATTPEPKPHIVSIVSIIHPLLLIRNRHPSLSHRLCMAWGCGHHPHAHTRRNRMGMLTLEPRTVAYASASMPPNRSLCQTYTQQTQHDEPKTLEYNQGQTWNRTDLRTSHAYECPWHHSYHNPAAV